MKFFADTADTAEIADLAAAYAFGIARNHPFIDGNKRTAAVVSETFLMLNGYALTASDAELVVAMLALAAGELEQIGEGAVAFVNDHAGAFGPGLQGRGHIIVQSL